MNLLALQRQFAASLRDGVDTGEPGMRVYRHAYRAQLLSCLQDTYEKTRAWLGEDAFDVAARLYIEGHPPGAWTLDAYGASFVDDLDTLYPDDPDVAELAWLDWHLRRAFAGADANPVDAASLGAVDWDQASLTFVPTLRFRPVSTNAAAIWRAIDDDTMSALVVSTSEKGAVRVWRQGLSTRLSSMPATETACLDLAMAGASFAELCHWLTGRMDNEQALTEAGTLLGGWLGDGLIKSIA